MTQLLQSLHDARGGPTLAAHGPAETTKAVAWASADLRQAIERLERRLDVASSAEQYGGNRPLFPRLVDLDQTGVHHPRIGLRVPPPWGRSPTIGIPRESLRHARARDAEEDST